MENKSKTVDIFIYICLINYIYCLSVVNNNTIIISLKSDKKDIHNSLFIINSILQQNIDESLFKILLFLSLDEFNDNNILPKEFVVLEKLNKIKIVFIKQKITNLVRTIITLKKYKNNPIIIINNICKLPEGWLKMFIDDHLKYPNDAIAASIQYYFGKNDEIIELSEGFKGEKYGVFNHVTEMVFNFAIINIDMGGILYPKNYFQNPFFYDEKLLSKISHISEEFLESAFIIIDDKILRQSSKIFDYTKYIINISNYETIYKNKQKLLQNDELLFLNIFPEFNESIKKRKKKIIVSITSYPKRFIFLPDLISFIKNQRFRIDKIFFFLYKKDIKYLHQNNYNINIISSKENLRPHLKYFYAMKLFRDFAIITLDDDIGYTDDTFESLFNAYIDNPNVISGRRTHLMSYDDNGELKSYYKWEHEQKVHINPEFNILITNVGGSIYPPDILNINDEFLPIIKETITCDDLTLKYFENIKGIPIKWIYNQNMLGTERILPKTKAIPLFKINSINNDICINKLNLFINKTILPNLCVQYRNITTGSIIYLFDIHNKIKIKNILYFGLYAHSHCPINLTVKFNILFDNISSYCFFKELKTNSKEKNITNEKKIIASCHINNITDLSINFDDYYNLSIKSEDNINIKIFDYKKCSTIIYKNFYCMESQKKCFLYVILYDNYHYDKLIIRINDMSYLCLIEINNQTNFYFPIIKRYECKLNNYFYYNNINYISGIPKRVNTNDKYKYKNTIPNQFFIHRTFIEKKKVDKNLIIIGKLSKDFKKNIYYFLLNTPSSNIELTCYLKPNSKFVLSKINCTCNQNNNISEIIIENQIIQLNNKDELLLINEETAIKLSFNNNIKIIKEYIQPNLIDFLEELHINDYFFLLILIFKLKLLRKYKEIK